MGASVTGGGRQGGGRRGRYRPMAEINVTPFVDVMLVLLIVFMVAAPRLTAGVQVDLPSSKAKSISKQESKPIELTIDKDGTVYLGKTKIKDGALISIIQASTEGDQDSRIYIRGDKDVEYGAIAKLLGELQSAGFNKVALTSRPEN